MTTFHQVIEEYNPDKEYSIPIRNQVANCLSLMKKGEQFRTFDFAREHIHELSSKNKFDTARYVVTHSLRVARKIGMVEEVEENHSSFAEFCQLETILHLKSQLRGSRYKHSASKSSILLKR